ncbi:oligosaccharide flippase family protein [Streptomyces sp. NPDC050095]|uniref:oligosaccharide flippase family protein n=1 Tax=unclassified Streptomyces TaxID=2593676 RepID=UPI003414EA54
MRPALRSLTWNYGGSAVQLVLQLGYTAATARLAPPDAFGAYALAGTAVALIGYVANSGLSTSVLRADTVTRALLRTVLTQAALFGLGSFVLALLAAPLVGLVLHGPHSTPMLQVLATQFLVQPMALAATAALRRLGRSPAAVRAETAGQVAGSAAALLFLYATHSPYALATAVPVAALATLLFALLRLRRTRIPPGDPVPRRQLLAESSFFTGFGLAQSVTNNAPLWLTGATAGAAAAGLYSRAALLTGIPLTVLAQGLSRAVTPALAAARAEGEVPPRAAYAVMCGTSALALAGLGALCGVGPCVLLLVLGDGWQEAARLVPVLALGAGCALLCSTGNSMDTAAGATRRLLHTQLAVSAATALTLAAAWRTGSLTLCAAATVTGPVAGHLVQLVRWHTARVLPVARLLRAHAVHALLGCALALAGHYGTRAGGLPTGLAAMVPVTLLALALRTRVPAYATLRGSGSRVNRKFA